MDQLFSDLNSVTHRHNLSSVHLADFPTAEKAFINEDLESQMEIAQQTSSLVLGLRKKEKIRVRQPLQKLMVPALNARFVSNILHVKELILSEVNVKELEILAEGDNQLVKRIKPNFKTIGPKYGKQMKAIAAIINEMDQAAIATYEANTGWSGEIEGEQIHLDMKDVEITAQDIPGWLVATEGGITVALDITISDTLKAEGIARELVNRVQNLRKDSGLEVTDRIQLRIDTTDAIRAAITANSEYICNEVLADSISFGNTGANALVTDLETAEDTRVELVKG
jgi:isoleucyl-tRNA synthetase